MPNQSNGTVKNWSRSLAFCIAEKYRLPAWLASSFSLDDAQLAQEL
jgi:hypothetical protein